MLDKRKCLGILLFYSVMGCLLRAYQLRNELLFDGSLAQGAFVHRVLFLLTICFAVGWILILRPLAKLQTCKECFSANPALNGVQMLGAVGMLVGNLLLCFGGRESASQYTDMAVSMAKWLPILGVLSACCIFAFAFLCMKGKKPSPLLYMAASVYLVVRLIVAFQEWNTDPSVHDYAYQLLATICCMLGSFQVAGFGFDKGKRRMTLFWTLCAVFFCAVSIPDKFENSSEFIINLSLLAIMAVNSVQLLWAKETEKTE